VFRIDKQIRFHHCDPAGIIFYPQYFVLFHELLEDWFNIGLGLDYARFVREQGLGLPTVQVQCEFLAPVSMGQILHLELMVERLGTSSITLALRGSAGGREVVRVAQTVVHTSLAQMRAVPISDELRAAIAAFQR
jgi:4-hydroxybenzoyl-CoA thioesterase